MFVKTLKKVGGIPGARATVAPGETDQGAKQVTLSIAALDSMGFPEMVTSLRLSVDEARDLATRIMAAAGAS